MSPAWRRSHPIAFHAPSADEALDSRFPRAVAGEEYHRYARVVWPQAQRWIRKHWPRAARADCTMDDARDVLHTLAGIDLARRLYPQEEQLLGELLQVAWTDWSRPRAGVVPEVPAFLSK
jgi:hypothetical protein